MIQRRKFQRAKTHFPVLCSLLGSRNQSALSLQGRLYDLSQGGMSISFPALIPIPSKIMYYYLTLPSPYGELVGVGEVRWTSWNPQEKHLRVGLEFDALNTYQAEGLKNFVTDLL